MKKTTFAALFALSLAVPVTASATAPAFIPIEGYLTDASGQPLTGDTTLTVRIYDAESGGTTLFEEVQAVYADEGYFTLYLGQNEPLDLSLFAQTSQAYLGVTIGTGAELEPRIVFGTTAYAAYAERAGDAATLGGQDAAAFASASHGHAMSDLSDAPAGLVSGCDAGEILKWDGSAWGCAADDGGLTVEQDPTVNALGKATLACAGGQVAKWTGSAWACAPDVDTDTKLSEAEVDAMVANNGYALASSLQPVATTGRFADLTGVPNGLADGDDDTLATMGCAAGEVALRSDTGWTCVSADASFVANQSAAAQAGGFWVAGDGRIDGSGQVSGAFTVGTPAADSSLTVNGAATVKYNKAFYVKTGTGSCCETECDSVVYCTCNRSGTANDCGASFELDASIGPTCADVTSYDAYCDNFDVYTLDTNPTLAVSGRNVGINNGSPAQALDVTGDAHVTGRLTVDGGSNLTPPGTICGLCIDGTNVLPCAGVNLCTSTTCPPGYGLRGTMLLGSSSVSDRFCTKL